MDENAKTRFEWVETIRKASWESYCSRREYEWKISLGLWGALLALLVMLAKEESKFVSNADHELVQWGTVVFGIVVWRLHVIFMRFVRQGHFIDQTRHEQCLEWQRKQAVWADTIEVKRLVESVQAERYQWKAPGYWREDGRRLLKRLRLIKNGVETLCTDWVEPRHHRNPQRQPEALGIPASDDPGADVLVLKWSSAHRFQMNITLMLVVAVNMIVWLR